MMIAEQQDDDPSDDFLNEWRRWFARKIEEVEDQQHDATARALLGTIWADDSDLEGYAGRAQEED